jgi:hypothetical protein
VLSAIIILVLSSVPLAMSIRNQQLVGAGGLGIVSVRAPFPCLQSSFLDARHCTAKVFLSRGAPFGDSVVAYRYQRESIGCGVHAVATFPAIDRRR